MTDAIRDVMKALAAMSDDGRERMKTPWSRNACSYATDGRMMIRTPRLNEFPDRAANDGVSATGDELAMAPIGPTWYDVPAVPPEPGLCPKCHGVPAVKCEACEGSGQADWTVYWEGKGYDVSADCPVCDGKGKVDCTCDNKPDEPPVKVGPALIRADYLRLLASLPGCRLAPVDGWGPVVFEFDGGRGAVMPVRR